jgi:hypothetical protein
VGGGAPRPQQQQQQQQQQQLWARLRQRLSPRCVVALQPGPWEMTDLRYHSELTRWASAEVAAPLRAQHTELVRAVQYLLSALAGAGK